MKYFFYLFFTLLLTFSCWGQTTVLIDFETTGDGYTPSTIIGSGFTDVFNVYDGSNHSGGSIGGNPSKVWAVEDISGNPSINLDQLNVEGATSFDFSIDMIAPNFDDWDSTDEMLITYSTDGGILYSNLMWVQHIPGGSSSFNEPAALDTDFDGDGECGTNTTLPSLVLGTGEQGCVVSNQLFKTFTVSNILLDSASTLDIKLQFNSLTSGDEGIYLDNIKIVHDGSGTCSTPTEISSLSSVVSNEQIDLSWSNGACYDEILIVAKENSPVTVSPVGDGTAYNANANFGSGTNLGNDEFAVYKGTGTSVSVIGLNNGTTYHFKTFTRKGSSWSAGVVINSTPFLIEEAIAGDLLITEISGDNSDGSGSNNNGYMEIYNKSNKYINLDNIQLRYFNTNPGNSTQQVSLSGSLNPASFVIVTQNGNNYASEFSDTADDFGSEFYFNGGDDGCDIYHTNNGIIDQFNDNGQGQSAWNWNDNFTYKRNTTASGALESSWDADGTNNTPRTKDNFYFWTGDQDTSWTDASNWDSGSIPISTTSVNITAQSNLPIIGTSIDISNLTIEASGTLTISKTGSLTTSGNLTNNGTVTLNSDAGEFASIIVEGTSSGNISYNRWVNSVSNGSTGWDLVGSPANGVTISSVVGDSDLATNGSNPTTYALGSFDNTDLSWTNINSNDTSGTLTSGQGYQMATTSGGTITFQGSVLTTSQSISISNNNPNETGDSGLSGSRWNLIANPFPSYINANSNANTNNFLSDNGAAINDDFEAIYGYDANGGYTVINNTSSATYIAPGQGFFVASVVGGGTITFDANTRTVTGGDDFVANRMANTSQEFYLRMYEDDNLIEDNKFYFDNGLTLGLDPGYDAGAFDQNMDIMSRLSEDDQGVGMAINAMGLNSLEENTVIPLVFNRTAGVEFSVSFEDSTIGEDVNVYLEDTVAETYTDLRSENFTLTPETDLSDMGRFYLRVGNTSLGGNDLEESYISVYKSSDNEYVTIDGLSNTQKANVKLFNVIGQQVLSKALISNQSTQTVSTVGLTTGVYIVRLEADNSVITKKIIIN